MHVVFGPSRKLYEYGEKSSSVEPEAYDLWVRRELPEGCNECNAENLILIFEKALEMPAD